MRLLLDTHTFIWWDSEPEKVSEVATEALQNSESDIFLSVVSVWEMLIKQVNGKLSLRLPLKEIVREHRQLGLHILPVKLRHVMAVPAFPSPHRAPFDRLLIAQAASEDLVILTADKVFSEYPIKTIW